MCRFHTVSTTNAKAADPRDRVRFRFRFRFRIPGFNPLCNGGSKGEGKVENLKRGPGDSYYGAETEKCPSGPGAAITTAITAAEKKDDNEDNDDSDDNEDDDDNNIYL